MPKKPPPKEQDWPGLPEHLPKSLPGTDETVFDYPTIQPYAIRAGWAPEEQQIVIQVLFGPTGPSAQYSMDLHVAYALANQIVSIGEELSKAKAN